MTTQVFRKARSSLTPGATFEGYRIDDVIELQGGSGGGVYAATRLESERPDEVAPWLPVALPELPPWLAVALKVFSGDAARQPSFGRELVEVAHKQARLRHPNVVSIHDVGTSPAPFLAMTLVRGPSLGKLIAARELEDPQALELVRCLASALEAARGEGLVYRGLLPSRVLTDAGDPTRPRLGDFGAGRPENADADLAGDVQALGSILYQCLTFEDPNRHSGRLRELRPDLPPALEGVLSSALDKDPRGRHSSPGELMEAIDLAYPEPRHGRRNVPALRRPGAARRSRPPAVRPGRGARRFGAGRLLAVPAIAVMLALISAAALGAIVAPGGGERLVPASGLDAGPLGLRYPANWVRATPEQVRVPGLELVEPQAVAPRTRSLGAPVDRALLAGRLEGSGLPDSLLSRLPRAPKRQPVELGAVQAYRYEPVTPRGFDREITFYVVPTSPGSVVMGCIAPAGSSAFLGSCERVVSTLRLRGETAVALAPSPRYAKELSKVVSRLNASRADARGRLRRARTRSGQGGNAARLSIAYRRARREASGITPPPGANQQHAALAAAFAQTGRAYRSMAAAARARANGRWGSARAAALSREQAAQGALRNLSALGYSPQR